MAADSSAHDVWAVGAGYEGYMGRWSRLVAREFVQVLGVSRQGRWLDVGCGAGALVQAIVEHADPGLVVGLDSSRALIQYARTGRVGFGAVFSAGDARSLPFAAASFDAIVSGLVLNFVQGPAEMVADMVRAGRIGSTIAVYVWDYAGGMEIVRHFWRAAVALDPSAAELDEGVRFPICAPDRLQMLFEGAGLSEARTWPIDVQARFSGFDDYWSPFLGGQGPAPGYAMSLPLDRRFVLRERIRRALPLAPDGSISLTARAWAVCGTKRAGR